MKHSNVIKALSKIGVEVTSKPHGPLIRFHGKGAKNYVEWFLRSDDAEAQSVCIHRNGETDDLMTDYFCGTYPETIKKLISIMSEK